MRASLSSSSCLSVGTCWSISDFIARNEDFTREHNAIFCIPLRKGVITSTTARTAIRLHTMNKNITLWWLYTALASSSYYCKDLPLEDHHWWAQQGFGFGTTWFWLWRRRALMRRQPCHRLKFPTSHSLLIWHRGYSRSGKGSSRRSRHPHVGCGWPWGVTHWTLCRSMWRYRHWLHWRQAQIGDTPTKRKNLKEPLVHGNNIDYFFK